MTTKRSRGAFEADLQAAQSPYVFYGTPLPPLDPGTRDDGSYVPIWKQEVTDERGRKRLHGAFTGGFSAGYFNTVGSKEGWTPSTFVSSRHNRAKNAKVQKIEDFMDEEDIREAEESKQLQTSEDFAGLGATQSQAIGRRGIIDILKTEGETMGVKLLKKMGWREGQGIGPKVRRTANLDDSSTLAQDDTHQPETHLFAPSDSPMVTFVRKVDHFGLGFQREERLDSDLRLKDDQAHQENYEDETSDSFFGGRLATQKPKQSKPVPRRGGFGVGILNDTGSDDEDPYSMGPRISYNRTIGGDKKRKKKIKGPEEGKTVGRAANPLLSNKPVFISKKTSLAGFRKCHDGRLPLDGFVLADAISGLSLSAGRNYAPPDIPPGWKSSKVPVAQRDSSKYMSTADAAKASNLDPKSRAELLGEEQLPGKSIFDWMTPEARERLVKATGRSDLPPALGEKAPKGFQTSEAERRKNLWDLVPKLDKAAAVQALQRAVGGWMPYSEDENKRARYRTFLEVSAGLKQDLPDRLPGSTTDDWVREMQEFTRAAEVFKPISGVMASRFTSARSTPAVTSNQPDSSTADSLLRHPPAKPEDPAEEAAKIGMFGPLTRSTVSFYPTRLLCKRFNIKPPAHVQMDPGDHPMGGVSSTGGVPAKTTHSAGRLELISQDTMDQLLLESGLAMSDKHSPAAEQKPVAIEPERNEALEGERPGEAVFKAIFGSDSEEDED
ncbi:G-patch domain protein, putative [Talaromyces stipitatus ATCC 10500]|uniref:G-patch domain protein, putative n=1 Tax=Talaromyces stipitatus (strain ATCC 10500 / CBS 375.48 / QM 6759 / NRRL 1006) TaxID=441959 RepID=B8LVN1_TALSN|nr:G-patch domain protein, putative [Talaromyces stipitatus ATCC 10500]EED24161.1 G-patch domain protein, putative [Talaromyces stipitatus ATCC 10500]